MTSFAEGRDRNRALGIYGAASGSGAAAGVLLGGVLTSYLSWSWIFFINVPVGVAAALLAPFVLRESRPDLGHRHFDFAGAATVTSGLMLLVYALTRATSDGWGSPTTLALLAGAAALIVSFVVVEHRSPWPLLPLRIFRLPTVAGANIAMAIVGGVAFSQFFVLTLYLQDVLRYSAVQSGVAFAAFALTVVVVSNVAQVVVGRIGVRATLTIGLARLGGLGRVADAAAGRRAVLLGSLPRVRARRSRHGTLVRAGHDREPRRRRPHRRGRRVRPREHEPPDRRRDRHRRRERDRGHVDRAFLRRTGRQRRRRSTTASRRRSTCWSACSCSAPSSRSPSSGRGHPRRPRSSQHPNRLS